MERYSLCWLIACVSMLAAPMAVRAEGTAAGTVIANTATVNYNQGGTDLTAVSNTDTVQVAEILDVVVTLSSPVVTVLAGATQEELLFTVTNTGNGTETFSLLPQSAGIAGDDFDPVLSVPSIYFDSDDSGDLSAGDVAYVPGSNDPVLAADATIRVLLVNDIPAAAPNGGLGRSQLTATAQTGNGPAGTVFAGQGEGGTDAVTGTTEASAAETGEYLVQTLQMSVVKTQAIADPFGGSQPVPGARITYRVVVTVTGSDTAAGASFEDAIPANTTYVTGSLALNGGGLSDASDADAGAFIALPAPRVQVQLGDLVQAMGPQVVEFAVTIN